MLAAVECTRGRKSQPSSSLAGEEPPVGPGAGPPEPPESPAQLETGAAASRATAKASYLDGVTGRARTSCGGGFGAFSVEGARTAPRTLDGDFASPFRPPTSCFRQLNSPSRRPTLIWLGAEGVPSTLALPARGTGARRERTAVERGLVSSCGVGLYSGVLPCMYPRILRTIHGATASILFPLCLLRERRLRPAAGFSLSEAARRGHTLVPRSVTPRTFRRPPSGARDEPVETCVQPTEADLGPVTPGPSTIPRIPPRLSIAPRGIFSRPLFSVAFCARHPPTHPLTARCSASRRRAPRGGQWG